jgi:hypothetical protein
MEKKLMTNLTSKEADPSTDAALRRRQRAQQKDYIKKSVSNRLNLLLPHIYKLIQ